MIPIRDTLGSTQTPYVVYALIAVNTAVFLYLLALPLSAAELLTAQYGLIPLRYSNPAWAVEHGLSPTNHLPYITGAFIHNIHKSFLHIVPNMWILYIFGSSLEARMGRAAFLLFYFICAVGANIVHVSFNPLSPLAAVGASGAVAGVVGGYAVAFPRARLVMFFPVLLFEAPAMAFVVFLFGFQIVEGAMELVRPSASAWWAHAAGFMLGMALAPFFPARKIKGRAVQRADGEGASAPDSSETSAVEPSAESEPVREKEVSG